MFIAVDLPEPLGPMIATNSPASMSQVDAAQRLQRGLPAAVHLGDAAQPISAGRRSAAVRRSLGGSGSLLR